MVGFFNWESLWIGKDLKRFEGIREALDAEKIPYKHKVVNRLGQWSGRGTVRGNNGSIGLSSEQMYEYEILVSKKDSSRAHRALEK